jgi:hypothetical protein
VGFEPTIAVLERAKTVRALDRSTTSIGGININIMAGQYLVLGNSFRLPDLNIFVERLCALVVRAPGYRSRGPSSIPNATRFSEK